MWWGIWGWWCVRQWGIYGQKQGNSLANIFQKQICFKVHVNQSGCSISILFVSGSVFVRKRGIYSHKQGIHWIFQKNYPSYVSINSVVEHLERKYVFSFLLNQYFQQNNYCVSRIFRNFYLSIQTEHYRMFCYYFETPIKNIKLSDHFEENVFDHC